MKLKLYPILELLEAGFQAITVPKGTRMGFIAADSDKVLILDFIKDRRFLSKGFADFDRGELTSTTPLLLEEEDAVYAVTVYNNHQVAEIDLDSTLDQELIASNCNGANVKALKEQYGFHRLVFMA